MFGEENNLKDTRENTLKDSLPAPVSYGTDSIRIGSYSKTDKLIAALYMVTDIIDHDEPLRNKLRTLGTEILSEACVISGTPSLVSIEKKIIQILSFLDIASSVRMISEMNAGILKKEFFELKKSLSEYADSNAKWLEGFLIEKEEVKELPKRQETAAAPIPIVHKKPVKDIADLKGHRREEILKIIKQNAGGLTITDIRTKAAAALASCGEKTLQRELLSMVHDGVLKKTGDKRWSRYFALN